MSESNTTRDFLLGLVFFGTIAFLIYATVALTGFSFAATERFSVWFPNAAGLKQGDAVLVSGHPTGKVVAVQYIDDRPDDRRIRVDVEFQELVRMREGYQITIMEFTLLGGRVIEIDPGPLGNETLPAGADLVGGVGPSALEAIGELVGDNRDDVRVIVRNLRQASEDLASGKGPLGALLADSAMKEDLDAALGGMRSIAEAVASEEGFLGTLVADEVVRDRLVAMINDGGAAVTDLRKLVEELADGEGTLGALMRDESLRANSVEMIANLAAAADGLNLMIRNANRGDGLAGRLLTDEEMSAGARSFIDDLAEIVGRLERGEGSLGHLLSEDEAYTELMVALRSLNGQLEDAREAQPVQGFASIIFNGF
ncbi:MAG TPA: MlaD family protein [Planctomycetota bacterium]